MEETPGPVVTPVHEEAPPVVHPSHRAPAAAPAPPVPLHPQLKSLLLELLAALVAIAERVDADHAGVQTAVSTLRGVQRHLEGL